LIREKCSGPYFEIETVKKVSQFLPQTLLLVRNHKSKRSKVATVMFAEIFVQDIRPGGQRCHEKIKLSGATPMRLP
jgi:hypothetical protein